MRALSRTVRTAAIAVLVSGLWAARVFAQGDDGFVAAGPGDIVTEHLPAAPLVFAAYAVVWVAVTIYVLTLWRRIGKAEREIAGIASRLEQKR